MKAYLYILKMQIILGLTYRFEVFAVIATKVVILVASIFLWYNIYSGMNVIDGVTLTQMTTYVIISGFISIVLTHNVQFAMNNAIRLGDVAVDMIRPYNLVASYFSKDLGDVVNGIVTKGLPVLIVGAIMFGIQPPASLSHFSLAIVSLILSYGILWFINASIALLSFWTMELGNMGVVMGSIVKILSGSIIPLWLFPDNIRNILYFTPFPYIYQTTLSLYIGKSTINRGTIEIGIQIIWVILLYGLIRFVWKNAKTRVLVQGG